MVRRSGRRRTALLAVSASVGLVVASAAPAQAAVPVFYGGTTSGDVVRLELTLPEQDAVVLGLVSANGQSVVDPGGIGSDPVGARAFAGLAGGTLVEGDGPLSPLNRSVTATTADPSPEASSIGSFPANPLGLSGTAGDVTASVTPGPGGSASVAQLGSVSLGSLSALLANLPAEVVDPVQDGLNTGAEQISGGLEGVISALEPITGPVSEGDPTDTVGGVIDTLNGVVADLPDLIAELQDQPLVALDGLRSEQSITQTGEGVTATASTKLAALEIFGTFVTLDGFENKATAFANGIAGGAVATPQPAVADVRIAMDLAVLGLDVDGLRAEIGAIEGIPAEVVEAVNTALDAVEDGLQEIFDATGVTVAQSAGSSTVSEDGRSALASASGLLINLAPGGTQLLSLEIGATAAGAVAQQPGIVVAPPLEPIEAAPILPRTGTESTLAGTAALLLIGGGVLLRRRKASELV